jgi:transposase
VEVYPINPKAMDRSRERFRANKAKSDVFDAYVLADSLRTDQKRLSALKPNSPQAAELKILTRDYQRLVRQQTRLINQIKATLKEYYPRPLEVFEHIASASCLDFLRLCPTPEAVKKLSFAQWKRFSTAHRLNPEKIQETWKILNAQQVPVPSYVERAKSKLLLALINQLTPTVEAVNDYRGEIGDFFACLPMAELTASLPGGKYGVIVPTLFAELGDAPGRWSSFRHLQAQAGTTPYTRQSGQMKTAHFRYSCNKHLRYAIYWLAQISLTQSDWARAYYDSQRARGHKHRQALRALGAKWLKIFFVMWQEQAPYDENRHLANIARHHLRQTIFA